MRIALVSRAWYGPQARGGLERHVTLSARHLLRQGAEVRFFTSDLAAGAAARDLKAWGAPPPVTAPYRYLPLRSNSIADRLSNYVLFSRAIGLRVARAARAGEIEVAIAHGLTGAGVARALGQDRAVPLLLNPHGMEEFSRGSPAKWLAYAPFRALLRAAARASARVIATDESLIAAVQRQLHVPPTRVALLPNGVDLEECLSQVDAAVAAQHRGRWDLDESSLLLLSVGRLEKNKGFDLGLAAVAEAAPHLFPSARWIIVGEGSCRHRLETEIHARGLEGRVILVGALDDRELHSLYSLATAVVVPSRYEGSSLVALEAMAHGRPVIATAVGGLPSKVLDGVTGILVSPGDTADLARALTRAAGESGRFREMGMAGQRLIRERFDWARLARHLLSLCETVRQEAG